MYSDRLVGALNDVAQTYRSLTYQAIYSVLTRIKNSGAGAASLKVEVIEGNTTTAPSLQIEFDQHLIIINQSKLEWTRLPDMKEMLAWAETKRNNAAEAKQLAWATAWDKKKNDTWKPKKWRKQSLSGVLKEMNERIVAAFDAAIEEDLTAATKGR